MTTQEKINYVRGAMGMRRGDDLEWANAAFGHMTDKQLDQQWGQSGKTCRQVWQEYRDWDAKWREVNEWLESKFPPF